MGAICEFCPILTMPRNLSLDYQNLLTTGLIQNYLVGWAEFLTKASASELPGVLTIKASSRTKPDLKNPRCGNLILMIVITKETLCFKGTDSLRSFFHILCLPCFVSWEYVGEILKNVLQA